jgi:hypothetical protein
MYTEGKKCQEGVKTGFSVCIDELFSMSFCLLFIKTKKDFFLFKIKN